MEAKRDMGRLPLRERNKQRIIRQIVEAARTLFREVGYERTTMDMIADKAEVSRGTLFNYFPTKTVLLLPFAGDLYEQYVQPEVHKYLEMQPEMLDALRFLFLKIGEQVLTHPDIEQALQQEFHSPQSTMKEESTMKAVINRIGFFDMLQELVSYGQQRGEVRADISVEKLAQYIGTLYVSLVRPMGAGERSPIGYTAEVETLLAFLRNALRS